MHGTASAWLHLSLHETPCSTKHCGFNYWLRSTRFALSGIWLTNFITETPHAALSGCCGGGSLTSGLSVSYIFCATGHVLFCSACIWCHFSSSAGMHVKEGNLVYGGCNSCLYCNIYIPGWAVLWVNQIILLIPHRPTVGSPCPHHLLPTMKLMRRFFTW